MDTVVALINSIAWPATVLVLAAMFRAELRAVFGRLSHVKYKDAEAWFDRVLRQAEAEAQDLRSPGTVEQLPPPAFHPERERILAVVPYSSRAAIMLAWVEVEQSAMRACSAAGIDLRGKHIAHIRGDGPLGRLVADGLLPPSKLPLYQSLRLLRNEATHASDFELGAAEAERFVDLALDLATQLSRIAEPSNPAEGTAAGQTAVEGADAEPGSHPDEK